MLSFPYAICEWVLTMVAQNSKYTHNPLPQEEQMRWLVLARSGITLVQLYFINLFIHELSAKTQCLPSRSSQSSGALSLLTRPLCKNALQRPLRGIAQGLKRSLNGLDFKDNIWMRNGHLTKWNCHLTKWKGRGQGRLAFQMWVRGNVIFSGISKVSYKEYNEELKR